jgi:hypothetical protein
MCAMPKVTALDQKLAPLSIPLNHQRQHALLTKNTTHVAQPVQEPAKTRIKIPSFALSNASKAASVRLATYSMLKDAALNQRNAPLLIQCVLPTRNTASAEQTDAKIRALIRHWVQSVEQFVQLDVYARKVTFATPVENALDHRDAPLKPAPRQMKYLLHKHHVSD